MTCARRAAWLAGALGVVVTLSAARAEILEQILVKVNGEIFTKTQLEARQVAVLRQRGRQMTDDELKKAIAEMTPQLLVDTVDEMLIVQRGRDLGYKLADDQFRDVLERIKKENKIETDEQFAAALKGENMTMADLRKQLERNMIIQRVQQTEVLDRISVTEVQAKDYYDQHASEFTTPVSITVREILVTVPGDAKGINVALDEGAKARADRIRERAAAGESFEKLAAELSDASSKANGGLVGPVNEDELDPALRKVIGVLKVGGISEVFRTSRGYLILKLETRSEKAILPFDQVRTQISERVANEKSRDEMDRFLVKLRASAIIEWKVPELKKVYDKRIAEMAANPGTP
jgi:peptidyl-prolyl cis-trans isomerase SurA